jgi:hypothetical protein
VSWRIGDGHLRRLAEPFRQARRPGPRTCGMVSASSKHTAYLRASLWLDLATGEGLLWGRSDPALSRPRSAGAVGGEGCLPGPTAAVGPYVRREWRWVGAAGPTWRPIDGSCTASDHRPAEGAPNGGPQPRRATVGWPTPGCRDPRQRVGQGAPHLGRRGDEPSWRSARSPAEGPGGRAG